MAEVTEVDVKGPMVAVESAIDVVRGVIFEVGDMVAGNGLTSPLSIYVDLLTLHQVQYRDFGQAYNSHHSQGPKNFLRATRLCVCVTWLISLTECIVFGFFDPNWGAISRSVQGFTSSAC